jgi:hypothetical protein
MPTASRDTPSTARIFGSLWIQLATVNNSELCGSYFFEKAPRSAKRASTPVKASKIPPNAIQPSFLFLIKKFPAK